MRKGWLERWRKWRRLRRYGVRPATMDDLDFVMAETIAGAQAGHYAESLLDQRQQMGFREQLTNVVRYQAMARLSERGLEQIRAALWIYGAQRDGCVGYMLYAETIPGSMVHDVELYKAGIRADRQCLGHGRHLIDLSIAGTRPGVRLTARCFAASDGMVRLLLAAGFSLIETTSGGTRKLIHQRAAANPAPAAQSRRGIHW